MGWRDFGAQSLSWRRRRRESFLSSGYDTERERESVTKPRVSLMCEKKRSNFSKLTGSSTRSLLPMKIEAVRTLFSAAIRMIERISAMIVSSTKVGW